MLNFKNDDKGSKVLTICKDNQEFKFEIESTQDLLNAFNFMFEADAVGKKQDCNAAIFPIDERWAFNLDRHNDAAIGVKGSAEAVFKMLKMVEKSGLKPDIRS